MPTDAELARKKYPRPCPTKKCHGYGFYWRPPTYTGIAVRMSREGANIGFRTVPCPVCGANPLPNGKP